MAGFSSRNDRRVKRWRGYVTFASHVYPDFYLLMPLYVCRRWDGFVQAKEGQELKWVRTHDLRNYPMPPADEPLISHLTTLI